jgi:type IV secretion system protein VirD4
MSKVHFVLDEMAVIGHMDSIVDALGIGRAYGIRLQSYLQDLAQAKKCFPNGQDLTLFSNSSHVCFGVNDNALAEYVSTRLGEHTIVVDSGGSSRSSAYQWSQGGQPVSRTVSYNSSSNWQQQPRKLLKPEEVNALSPRTAITFTPGVPPICTTLLRYYEEEEDDGPAGWMGRTLTAGCTLIASATLFALVAFLAVLLTFAVDAKRQAPARNWRSQHYEWPVLNEHGRTFRR